jgi:1-acyl-sn-glycerol-3-phosphate acyltransferase
MLRGIWAFFVLTIATVVFGLPVVILGPLFPRWTSLSTGMLRSWSSVMLRVVGARVRYHDPAGALRRSRCIFIANHQSNVDIWVLGKVLPQGARFVAKHELFRIPVLGRAMRASGFIPINRSNRAEAVRSLTRAAETIRTGRPVILFPEGTRSRDGKLQPFKKGAFHLALLAGVPVVPVVIRGTFEIMPPKSIRVRPGPVEVQFEEPIDPVGFGSAGPHELLQAVRQVMAQRLDATVES